VTPARYQQPLPDHARVAPVAEPERFEALDVLRGCAVLGILLMNIQMFSMPFSAYFNPTALGAPSARDYVIWCTLHLLADQKFMTIFSLLFGAGVFLMTSRISERGGRPAVMHYRRMGWLLVFGFLHAYLLWHGDILVLYALCGLWIYPARRLAPRRLLTLGAVVLAIGSSLSIVAGLSMRFWPPEQVTLLTEEFWSPPAARIEQEIAAFRGGWLAQLPWRAAFAFEFHMFDIWFWGIWRATGLMLAGMALCKLGVLTGERPGSFYNRLATLGLTTGLPMVAFGLVQSHSSGWNVRDAFFLGLQWNYWGSLLVSLAWMSLILRWWQARAARGLITRLAAVGRMAFSCYIGETIICTTVFYGHGLGLFATIDRLGQMLVTIAVWSVLLVAAPLWLARFRFGPLEWVWRLLTYGHIEPIGRTQKAPVPAI
jgi:uncharacterized protein